MKKSPILLSAVLVAMVVFSASAFADYTTVKLYETGVSPASTGRFNFPTLGDIGQDIYYGEYDLMISYNDGATYTPISGFCVEDAYSVSSGTDYELIPVSDWGSDFEKAAWVLKTYLDGGVSAQAAQIAIWELTMDPGDYDPTNGSGNFYAKFSNAYVTEAYNLINDGSDNYNGGTYSGYMIAHSPIDSENPEDPQDYIIPVPEPGMMLMLGVAFGFIAAFWKKIA